MTPTVPEGSGELGLKLMRRMDRMTWDRNGLKILDNARYNAQFLDRGQSLAALRKEVVGQGDSAVVIAAGPSIKRRDPAARIKAAHYKGAIVCTDSGIAYCLRNGIVPDLVVSLDPDATRIVRWFGDPELTKEKLATDDYFRRQDMDTDFSNELRANDEVLELLNRHGKDMRIALCSSASKAVVDRVMTSGMSIYWWNAMLDDPDQPDSATRKLYEINRLPCLNAGGNVGTACWMMADAVLGKAEVALTGVDFSYYGDTPYVNTQYYHEAVALVGQENLDSIYIRLHNPYIDAEFYTDPAYMWYREAFLDMAQDAQCRTFNCTEGGILFGDKVDFIPLDDFLKRHI